MRLRQLVQPFLNYQITGAENPDILHIVTDSRQATAGTLFAAIPGHTVDGHAFAAQAVENGAAALLVERRIENIPRGVPQVIVRDSRHMAALLADRLFGRPSRRLRVVGVTGTNGKTTVTHLVRHLLEVSGKRTGVIGTVGAKYGDVELPLPNTTPEAVEVHRLLRVFADAGCSHAVMEVSSHALVERRAAGVAFASAAFTNLTQDHLDFHGTMERYAAAKSLLFARLGNAFDESTGNAPHAVINADDPWAQTMMDATTAPILTYGIEREADIRAEDVQLSAAGAHLRVRTPVGILTAHTGLIGHFNVYNALAAIAIALVEGVQLDTIATGLASYAGVPGRCERIDGGQPFGVFVDYAHTPDGVANILTSVREFAQGRVIVVIGCGGDRDRTKRPRMAETAAQLADLAIFTSDNPRSEDPHAILADMRAGIPANLASKVREQVDRRQAIRDAIREARPTDIVVIAGKGHEDYQIIGSERLHFDDREEARLAIADLRDPF
ncbi:UDP-N-acetylmuramoyl-L-alanyl-D-glutamate--2,6-diaminopimelate ligase [Alicyclobacillus hesperidum]|uniref:UDP-N-acetylmuramoyl-L-alanyl-D-glutamate--2,6-diaminopimelate ligase n=1 Tax=Alicyclobacillus hesperidum TaxID=89784 RepID=A0AA37U4B8_9BACL|nr:UDP-N-acetylmuramoyl-L-alanyl-D-glutamate--2,6-diaminopimelate ligase [Alicyclobacillus hesperidum]GLV13680.1 UDP-N-acetylmuramoyl-L-alanyl-D-glutamate--2,6-diaminopimelate ligase [Alicyclobacillus hesperidum]